MAGLHRAVRARLEQSLRRAPAAVVGGADPADGRRRALGDAGARASDGSRRRLMASRRDEIKLSDSEQRELIDSERVVVIGSQGLRGWPHLMPLWYVPRDGEIWIYTYAKSQKVRNLERDNRATLLIETGHEYNELRGVSIEAEAEIHRDAGVVFALAQELTIRYTEGLESVEGEGRSVLEAQAKKRVAIRFVPQRVASWDHSKLGGTY